MIPYGEQLRGIASRPLVFYVSGKTSKSLIYHKKKNTITFIVDKTGNDVVLTWCVFWYPNAGRSFARVLN